MKPAAAMNSARLISSSWRRRGAAKVEVLLLLVIFALAGGLVYSTVHRVRQQTRGRQFEKQLQEFAAVFADYRARRGDWPDTTTELNPRLAELGWTRPSPFGGEYSWKPSGVPGQAGSILLTAFHPRFPLALNVAELTEVDRHLDDGQLASGRFRTGFNGWPAYQLAKNP